MNKTIAGVLSAGLLTVSLGFGAMPASATSNDGTVKICHATSSAKNPFIQTSIDSSALEHHKMHQEGQDIYPVPAGGCPTNNPTPEPTDTPTTTPLEPTEPPAEEPTDPALPCPPPNGCANPGPDFPYTPEQPETPAAPVPTEPAVEAPVVPVVPVAPEKTEAPAAVAPEMPSAAPVSPVEASAVPSAPSASPTANRGVNVQTAATDELAETGATTGLVVAGGAIMLGLGAGVVLYSRKVRGTHQ